MKRAVARAGGNEPLGSTANSTSPSGCSSLVTQLQASTAHSCQIVPCVQRYADGSRHIQERIHGKTPAATNRAAGGVPAISHAADSSAQIPELTAGNPLKALQGHHSLVVILTLLLLHGPAACLFCAVVRVVWAHDFADLLADHLVGKDAVRGLPKQQHVHSVLWLSRVNPCNRGSVNWHMPANQTEHDTVVFEKQRLQLIKRVCSARIEPYVNLDDSSFTHLAIHAFLQNAPSHPCRLECTRSAECACLPESRAFPTRTHNLEI